MLGPCIALAVYLILPGVRTEYQWTGTEWVWVEPGAISHITSMTPNVNYDEYYEDEDEDYDYSHLVDDMLSSKEVEDSDPKSSLSALEHQKVKSCCPRGSRLTLRNIRAGGNTASCVTIPRQDEEEVVTIPHLEFVGTSLPKCGKGMVVEEVKIMTTELTTTTTTTTTTTPLKGWMQGWCLDQYGNDQNSGVTHLGWRSSAEECLEDCRENNRATGCEFFRGSYTDCVVHTRSVVTGNGDDEHKCFVFSETEVSKEPGTDPEEKSYNAELLPSGQLSIKQKYDSHKAYGIAEFCIETTWQQNDKIVQGLKDREAIAVTCDMCKDKVFCHYLEVFYNDCVLGGSLSFITGELRRILFRATGSEDWTCPKHLISAIQLFDDDDFNDFKTRVELFLKDFSKLFDSGEKRTITELRYDTVYNLVEFIFDKLDIDWDEELTVDDWNKLTGRMDTNIGRKLITLPLPVYQLYTRIDPNKDEALSLDEIKDFVKRTFVGIFDKNQDCHVNLAEVVGVLEDNKLPKDLVLAVKLLVQSELTVANTFLSRLLVTADSNNDDITTLDEMLNYSDFDFLETEGKEMLMLGLANTNLVNHIEKQSADTWLETLQGVVGSQVYHTDVDTITCSYWKYGLKAENILRTSEFVLEE